MQTKSLNGIVRFGSFEADLKERKLTKMGVRIRLQEQPFRILVLLLQRPGELVTREEIRQELWPQDVLVGFDAALNTAVRKLRDVLNDSADNPRFLETIPRQGYRFIAPVVWSSLEAIPIKPRARRALYFWFAISLALAIAAVGEFWRLRHSGAQLTADDTVVLADFINKTGDPTFDDSLNTALRLSLRQSPFFKLLSQSEVAKTLQRMTRPPGTQLTAEVANELCQRAESKAYMFGSIATIGSKYVLGLKAVNCHNGDTLAEEQAIVASKDSVLDALGEAASRLRRQLGESLSSVQKFDVPLSQATTPSLEALKEYSLGLKVFNEKGASAELPYSQRAIDLDPGFAIAYRAVGQDYTALGEIDRAKEYYSKAFQLRERTSEREKMAITADYYMNVTGELDKAAEAYERWIASYPRNYAAYSTVGIVYAMQGQYEKANEITLRALRIAPTFGSYANLALYELALQRFDDGRRVVHEGQAAQMDGFELHEALYALAFLGENAAGMAEEQKWFAGRPEESIGLALASDTEAYRGRLGQARDLTVRAVEAAIHADSKERGAILLANAALREAVLGNATEARQTAAKALKLVPASPGIQVEAALAFAMAGDTGRAKSLEEGLRRRFPSDTQIQLLWLPAIQTQLALSKKNRAYTLNPQQSVSSVEYGGILFNISPSCLYPTYVRGEAYLASGWGIQAAQEFQKILNHGGIVWNCWTGALARLGLARANTLQWRISNGTDSSARGQALKAYKDFLTLWKDADPDVPILNQAKSEYDGLLSNGGS